jgi:hypothetical protein
MIRKFLAAVILASALLTSVSAVPAVADGCTGGCLPNYPPDPGCEWVWNGTTYVQVCATDPQPDPCQTKLDEQEDYYLAVIGNYKDSLASALGERDEWHAAHDRVAAAAVQRNIEYAAEVRKNEVLTYKVGTLRSKVQQLREKIRALKE